MATYSIHGHPLAGSGCLVESKHQETQSKRLFVARLERQNMMKLGIGFTREAAELSSPLLVYIDLLALLYILHA